MEGGGGKGAEMFEEGEERPKEREKRRVNCLAKNRKCHCANLSNLVQLEFFAFQLLFKQLGLDRLIETNKAKIKPTTIITKQSELGTLINAQHSIEYTGGKQTLPYTIKQK